MDVVFVDGTGECEYGSDVVENCDSAVDYHPEANVCGESDSTEMLELFQCPLMQTTEPPEESPPTEVPVSPTEPPEEYPTTEVPVSTTVAPSASSSGSIRILIQLVAATMCSCLLVAL